MEKQARHRPHRVYPNAKRLVLDPDIETCPVCGQVLKARRNWHSRKTIQTLNGPLFVAGKTKECLNSSCRNYQKRYYASRVWLYILPGSTYGLDVVAWIDWQHEHEHRQLVEIQRFLNQRGIAVNERNVGKLYRQFLALLSATSENARASLEQTAREYGGLIWAVDALQPEVPHQRCQAHFLNNLAEDVLEYDDELRKNMRQDLGGLPKVPTEQSPDPDPPFSTDPTQAETASSSK